MVSFCWICQFALFDVVVAVLYYVVKKYVTPLFDNTRKGSPIRIVVASKNPSKIASVRNGFQRAFGNRPLVITGVSVPSGVSDQPIGVDETISGVYNRIRGAAEKCPDADFFVALEAGISETPEPTTNKTGECHQFSVINYAGVAKHDNRRALRVSVATSAAFPLPVELGDPVAHGGEELGPVCDRVFAAQSTKTHLGAVGHLTEGKVHRDELGTPAIFLALVPFLGTNKELSFALPSLD